MPKSDAVLPGGTRITDLISLGVIAKTFPRDQILQSLAATGRESKRQRDMPAHVVIYYVIAMALFMQVSCREVLRCLLQSIRWLSGDAGVKVTGRSGIAQARARVGDEPVRHLHDALVKPIASPETIGAYYRRWRVVSIDGSVLDVPDTQENAEAFGRPTGSRGSSAFPQLRFVSLVESGTHVLFASEMGDYRTAETTLARKVLPRLTPEMLCLADRFFFGFELWKLASGTGAALAWRVKKNLRLPREKVLEDGSFLSTIYATDKDRRHKANGFAVRVVEYALKGVQDSEPVYRVITTILDPAEAPAAEVAALYHERWEIETALDEFKTHLRGAKIVFRSKRPDLVRQEFYGFMMAHFAVRGLMHEASLKAAVDPDRLSFVHAVRVIRRNITAVSIPPSGLERAPRTRPCGNPGGTCSLKPRTKDPERGEEKDE